MPIIRLLFGPELKKQPIDDLLKAFADRLKKVAGFTHVSQALPMRNSTGVILYHLIFATHYEVPDQGGDRHPEAESARRIDGDELD